MAWSIVDVARMSRVTSRTLRHYDATGLLRPAYTGSNGYRYYERTELLRLQEILLLRELGLRLETIAQVLNGETDRAAVLRRHVRTLHAERDRLDRLADTVARTIAHLDGGVEMPAELMFEGFAERRDELEERLVAEHGEGVRQHFRDADDVTARWTDQDRAGAQAKAETLNRRLAAVLRSGASPDSAAAQEVVAEHYQSIAEFWTPNRSSYANLGQLYLADPQFREHYDAVDPALAPWLAEAIAIYARNRLS